MENYRDTRKSAKQAKPIQDVIQGLGFIHDHVHYEDGVLVEDKVPDVAGRDLGGVALNRWDSMGNYMDVDL